MELCEDLWTPIPPSTYAALAGATVLLNLSASNITIGKAGYRNDLCAAQSGKCIAAYLYSAAGPGESTTDLAWDGHAVIFEDNRLLAESERFPATGSWSLADIDLERAAAERLRVTSFATTPRRIGAAAAACAGSASTLDARRRAGPGPEAPHRALPLRPGGRGDARDALCYEAYNIQVHGLAKRLTATGIERIVIGVSGGLDSTQALLVAARTMDRLGLPRSHPRLHHARLRHRCRDPRQRLGADAGARASAPRKIDIRPSCTDAEGPGPSLRRRRAGLRRHLRERPGRRAHLATCSGSPTTTTPWCSAPATSAEIALGWSTYGVGDQMSHYNVNASVPKTLIQYLIRWVIATRPVRRATNADPAGHPRHRDLPRAGARGRRGRGRRPAEHRGQDRPLRAAGLQHLLHHPLRPEAEQGRLPRLACLARPRPGRVAGQPARRRAATNTTLATIRHWLEVFCRRFFADQPVQAHLHAERPQGRRRLPLAPAATGAPRATPRPRSG
jgi:NAD+ synthase (glutamine-hydrolysing)